MYNIEHDSGRGYNMYFSLENNFKNIIVSISEIPKRLKQYLQELKEKSEQIFNNETITQSMNEFMYPFFVDDMFRKANNIINFLNEHKLTNEYYAFLEIKQMMKVIIKNKMEDNKIDELTLLDDILSEFISLTDLIFSKCNSKDELSNLYGKKDTEYLAKYEKFEEMFFKYQTQFYSEICTINKDDETIVNCLLDSINLG
ncbi:MAG: hypothetical protein LBU40_01425 [Methanobrevibacter sp.]|jgi:hypothetical protein|nr:hypothetical protein [Methanobrevibacter sp.]